MIQPTDEQLRKIAQETLRVCYPAGYSMPTRRLIEAGKASLRECSKIVLADPLEAETAKAGQAMDATDGNMRIALKSFVSRRRLDCIFADPAVIAGLEVVKRFIGVEASWEEMVPEIVEAVRKVFVKGIDDAPTV